MKYHAIEIQDSSLISGGATGSGPPSVVDRSAAGAGPVHWVSQRDNQ
jgi:hypothetical protein